jgi:cell division transport system permease protein
MARKENKKSRLRMANAYLSSLISISLVLLLIGVAALLLLHTRSISDWFKENMQVSVIMKDAVREDEARAWQDSVLNTMDCIASSELVSREQGEQEMAQLLGDDFLSVFATSPVPVSFTLHLRADYVAPDSIAVVRDRLEASPLVEEVSWQQSLVEALNANLSRISLVLTVLVALLLFISFVLIGNTVRLSLHERRFVIHTMRLVGATRAFIRRPFLVRALFQGVFAAFLAILVLLGLLFVVRDSFREMFAVLRPDLLLWTMGIVLLSGMVICTVSAFITVNRLTALDKDELYEA